MQFETKISREYLDQIMATDSDLEHVLIASKIANEIILGSSLYCKARNTSKSLPELMTVMIIAGGELAAQIMVASALSKAENNESIETVWREIEPQLKDFCDALMSTSKKHLEHLHGDAQRIVKEVRKEMGPPKRESYYDGKEESTGR
jgi:hypothetical protein